MTTPTLHQTSRTPAIDVVYMWVDGAFPGYGDVLSRYAETSFDRDPARTRDNLDLLKYSLRSLERHAPWIRKVFILTCRPQVPSWLDLGSGKVEVIHHDQVIDPAHLPTFNSLAIVSHVHKIPGLSPDFIYLDDDILFLRPVTPGDFTSPQGRQYIFPDRHWAPRYDSAAAKRGEKPWNLALSASNELLDQLSGVARRRQVNHVPLMINRDLWQEMLERFPDAVERTRRSRFRADGNIAVEFMYPYFLLALGKAEFADAPRARASSGYLPLEDFWPWTAWKLRELKRRNPLWATLNDNFGPVPNPRAERLVKAALHNWLPQASPYERPV